MRKHKENLSTNIRSRNHIFLILSFSKTFENTLKANYPKGKGGILKLKRKLKIYSTIYQKHTTQCKYYAQLKERGKKCSRYIVIRSFLYQASYVHFSKQLA